MIITISRQTATNGELIGRLVAERLGMRYLDRELLEELAHRLQVDPGVVTQFDESALNSVQSLVWEWLSSVNEHVYIRSLRQALLHIFSNGDAVVVGRGANFVLRCHDCLHVRLVAPLTLRCAIYRAAHEVSLREAEHAILQVDHARAQFVRTLFHANIDDPEHYDLVVNLTDLAPEAVTTIIAQAALARRAQPVAASGYQAILPAHIEIMGRHRRPVRPATLEHEYHHT